MISRFAELRLLQLSLRDIGPFRERTRKFRFMGALGLDADGEPRGEAPANLYMLFAMNGMGKTTILRAIYTLMALMGNGEAEDAELLVFGEGARAQLDLRMTLTIDDTTRTTLVSLWYGSAEPLVDWSGQDIDEVADSTAWAKVGFVSRGGEIVMSPYSNELGRDIRNQIVYDTGTHPTKLFGLSSSLPSVIFFPANRTVVPPVGDRVVACPREWGYRPAQIFEADGPVWERSIDSALVWLEWLEDGRIHELLEYVNDKLFREGGKSIQRPRRDTLAAVISTREGNHTLGDLSHGERALLQLYVRTSCHMTENTVLLIDEIENHLHTKWMNRLFAAMKSLILDVPSLSVVFTTHNRELMKVFDHTRAEDGLVKGGYLIEEGID